MTLRYDTGELEKKVVLILQELDKYSREVKVLLYNTYSHLKSYTFDVLPYSLNISRGEIFADFTVLRVISKNLSLETFRPPYSLIHCLQIHENFIFSNTGQPRNIFPSKYLGYTVYAGP